MGLPLTAWLRPQEAFFSVGSVKSKIKLALNLQFEVSAFAPGGALPLSPHLAFLCLPSGREVSEATSFSYKDTSLKGLEFH